MSLRAFIRRSARAMSQYEYGSGTGLARFLPAINKKIIAVPSSPTLYTQARRARESSLSLPKHWSFMPTAPAYARRLKFCETLIEAASIGDRISRVAGSWKNPGQAPASGERPTQT